MQVFVLLHQHHVDHNSEESNGSLTKIQWKR